MKKQLSWRGMPNERHFYNNGKRKRTVHMIWRYPNTIILTDAVTGKQSVSQIPERRDKDNLEEFLHRILEFAQLLREEAAYR